MLRPARRDVLANAFMHFQPAEMNNTNITKSVYYEYRMRTQEMNTGHTHT